MLKKKPLKLEKNRRLYLYNLRKRNEFLSKTQNAKTLKEKLIIWTVFKISVH